MPVRSQPPLAAQRVGECIDGQVARDGDSVTGTADRAGQAGHAEVHELRGRQRETAVGDDGLCDVEAGRGALGHPGDVERVDLAGDVGEGPGARERQRAADRRRRPVLDGGGCVVARVLARGAVDEQ